MYLSIMYCNAIIQEAKARGSWVGEQPRLHSLSAAWDAEPPTIPQKLNNERPWGLTVSQHSE